MKSWVVHTSHITANSFSVLSSLLSQNKIMRNEIKVPTGLILSLQTVTVLKSSTNTTHTDNRMHLCRKLTTGGKNSGEDGFTI